MSKFQIITIAFFVTVSLIAVLIFAGLLPGFRATGPAGTGEQILMWGSFPNELVDPIISDLNQENKDLFRIKYFEKRESVYENEIVNALAAGKGPDIWIFSQETALKNKDKVFEIPFESFQERDYKDTFIESAELFIDKKNEKYIGLPLAIDPIILYWNRDLFSSAGIARPPQYWDEFLTVVKSLTKRDNAGNIIQTGAAMGAFRNIKNAKEILSLLVLQAGNPIIERETLDVVFGEKGTSLLDPAESSVRFFNEFSNPSKLSYSWNSALASSDMMFVNGSLAMYFGYASEFEDLQERNPHLNFDVTGVPQVRDGKINATFGKIYGLAISKISASTQSAFSALYKLTEKDFSINFSKKLGLGSARRDVLSEGTEDPNLSLVYKSSIMSKSWLEPDPQKVSEIFRSMIESTVIGRVRISEGVKEAKRGLEELVKIFND